MDFDQWLKMDEGKSALHGNALEFARKAFEAGHNVSEADRIALARHARNAVMQELLALARAWEDTPGGKQYASQLRDKLPTVELALAGLAS